MAVLIYFNQFGYNKLSISFFFCAISVPLLFGLVALFEYGDFFLESDEIFYWDFNYLNAGLNERLSWIYVNALIKTDPFISSFVFLKFINVAFLLLLVSVSARVHGSNNLMLLSFIFLPYFLFMTTLNLRDIFALTISLGFVNLIYVKKMIWKVTFGFILLFLLYITRWFYIPMCLVSIVIIYVISKGKNKLYTALLVFFVMFVAIGWFYYFSINSTWVMFLLENGLYSRNESFQNVTTGNLYYDISSGILRYIFAPLPTSMLSRGFDFKSLYHSLEDFVRFINQTMYYFSVFYCLVNIRKVKGYFGSIDQKLLVFYSLLFSHAVIYGVYFLGVTHQRVKLPFQLGVVVLALSLFIYKSNRVKLK